MKRHRIPFVAVLVTVALVSGGWLLQRAGGSQGSVYQQARLFDDVLAHVADYYVDSIGERRLYEMAIDGLLEQLGDPYSSFLKPDDFRSLVEATTGNYGGLGIQIDVRDGWITVIAPLPDTPAERAGIESGDRIVGLNGESTAGWNNDRAVRELRGEAGTTAVLAVRRVGLEEPLTFRITRATIHIRSVQVSLVLDQGVGYVALNPVNETSADELREALTRLRGQGARALILDLRGNPGGLLDQAVAVSDLFLDRGQEVVTQRGRAPGTTRTFTDTAAQEWAGMPVVVLVNGFTASAAEIISGALQDHDRAVIVGTTTFGKGLVQSFWRLTPQSGLKLTTARWYTPSGRQLQRPVTSEEEPDAAVAAAPAAPDSVPVDSALIFHTSAGRAVYGGGGIRPDLLVQGDTFTTAERRFTRALGAQIPVFRDVLVGYVLELKAARRFATPAFTVDDPLVDEVVRRLRERGVALTDEVVAGARRLIAQELGYESARYVFGRDAEFRRRMRDDRQVQQALALARQASTPAELLSLATARAVEPAPR